MQTQKFNFDTLKNKFYEEPIVTIGRKQIRKVSDSCIEYIAQYFFQSINDNYYFWNAENKQFVLHSKETMKNVYFSKLPDEINIYFFKERTTLYEVVSEVNKPRLYDNKINLFQGFKHENVKPYAEYSKKIRKAVELYLSYMKEVLCSNDQASFEYILKWTANMCKGKKNDSCLYMKGIEGIGKSSFSDFLKQYVLGGKITTNAGTDALRTTYNKKLCGMLLVVFEELPNFGDREWEGVSSTLKDFITGLMTWYSDKYEKAFEARNINNYIINANVEALKNSDGRRYFIVPLSTKRKGDFVYFGQLRDMCFNDDVGEAFFSYCLEIDTTHFKPQDMPTSIGKRNAIAERLDTVYEFLKQEFILKRKGISMQVNDLYDLYHTFCVDSCKKVLGKIKFCTKLRDVQIEYRPSNGKNVFVYTQEQLAKIADDGKWIHELDLYDDVTKIKKKTRTHDLDDDDREEQIQQLQKQLKKCNEERIMNRISLWLATHNIVSGVDNVSDVDNEAEELADMFD